METQLTKFSEVDGAIATMAAQFLPLKIQGVDDAVGFKRVHSARMEIKGKRVDLEKARKAYKADALAWGKKVDSEAKRIAALLAPIEAHLESEEDAYTAAKEAIKNAARIKAEAEEKARREAEEARLKAEREAEVARLAAERAALDAERKKMEEERAAERKAFEAEQAKIAAAQRERDEANRREAERLQALKRKVAADLAAASAARAAEQQAIELEKARQEAAERARIETEKRLAREAEEKAAREKAAREAAEAAKAKAEAMRPDKEKLLGVAWSVSQIEIPAVSPDATEFARGVRKALADAETRIKSIVASMADDLNNPI